MFHTSTVKHWRFVVAFAAVYGLLALVVGNSYYQLIMANVLVWAVLGLAWNLLSGYSGLISFGHAAFFGLGAYFVVLAQAGFGLTPWIGIPLAAALGGVAGLLVGVPTFRLRGHYFALAMLAYPLALLYIFEWLGLQEVAVPMVRDAPTAFMQFDDRRVYVLIGLVVTVAVMTATRWLEASRYGMSLRAVKQDETAAEAAGIDTLAWKLKAIALSGSVAAAIGGFYAVVQLVVTPLSVFGVLVSAQALIVAMFGGVGTLWGPVIGAVTLVPLSAWLDARLANVLPGIQGVVYGIAIIAVVLLAPEGLFWKARDLIAGRRDAAPANHKGNGNADRNANGNSYLIEPPGPNGGLQTFRIADGTLPETLLEVRGVSKAFGGLKAVDDVSFDVARGEILGIIGPNGAGKTTLFNVLNGLTSADAGTIRFLGEDVTGLMPNRICRRGIGRTFQVVKPFARMSIADNVIIGAYVAAGTIDGARGLAADALAQVGLDPAAALPAATASTLQLRLMEIARALAAKPRLLLLDEVFAGLGKAEVTLVMSIIDDLSRLGITIVIIEHTMQAMVQLVDRFIVLDHGAVLAEGPPGEITHDPKVIEAYLGKKWLEDARR